MDVQILVNTLAEQRNNALNQVAELTAVNAGLQAQVAQMSQKIQELEAEKSAAKSK